MQQQHKYYIKHKRFNDANISLCIIGTNSSNFKLVISVNTPITNFYTLVVDTGNTIIKLLTSKIIKLPKNITVQISGYEDNQRKTVKYTKNFFKPYEEIENVFSFVGISVFELFEIYKSADFYHQLLVSEELHITKTKKHLPHLVAFNNISYEDKATNDSIYNSLLIQNLIKKEEDNLIKRPVSREILKERTDKLISLTTHIDLLNFHFGNYDKVENIYRIVRLYATSKMFIHLPH